MQLNPIETSFNGILSGPYMCSDQLLYTFRSKRFRFGVSLLSFTVCPYLTGCFNI